MSPKLAIAELEIGNVTVLTLTGQLVLDDGGDLDFRRRIHDLVERGRVQLVLDMSGVTYIDSAGVGMIVGKLKTVRERGGDMKLLNLNTRGLRIFGISKLLLIFETFDDQAKAVKSFDYKVH